MGRRVSQHEQLIYFFALVLGRTIAAIYQESVEQIRNNYRKGMRYHMYNQIHQIKISNKLQPQPVKANSFEPTAGMATKPIA